MNINDNVWVRLTETGERLWKKHWEIIDPLGVPKEIRQTQTERDGRIRFQLWELMSIFGNSMRMSHTFLPFIDNEIHLERE